MNRSEVKAIGVLLIAACICFAIAAFQKALAADSPRAVGSILTHTKASAS